MTKLATGVLGDRSVNRDVWVTELVTSIWADTSGNTGVCSDGNGLQVCGVKTW